MAFRHVLALIFSVQISVGSTNSTFRKHKVHNIVLYPDKHSWCTSTPIKQVISEVDCEPVEMDNRVCLGACFSYSIPKTLPTNNIDEVNSYCDSCQPIETSWIPVELTCKDGSNHTKHVQLIKECRCSSCNRHWEFDNPLINDDEDKEILTETSGYLELMKLEQDKNAKDEENATTDTTNISNMEILDALNSAEMVYKKNIWIRGPHHSKVQMKKKIEEMPNLASKETQQYLREDTIGDKN